MLLINDILFHQSLETLKRKKRIDKNSGIIPIDIVPLPILTSSVAIAAPFLSVTIAFGPRLLLDPVEMVRASTYEINRPISTVKNTLITLLLYRYDMIGNSDINIIEYTLKFSLIEILIQLD